MKVHSSVQHYTLVSGQALSQFDALLCFDCRVESCAVAVMQWAGLLAELGHRPACRHRALPATNESYSFHE